MRKVLIAAGVVLALLVIVALVAPSFIDVNQYHGQIQGQLEKKLNRKVELGQMGLHLIPFSFSVQNANISEDPSFRTGRPFATIKELNVHLKLWPLILHKDVQVESLSLTQPQIELVRNPAGEWNFSSIQEGGNATPGTAGAPQPPARKGTPPAQQKPAPAQQPAAGGSSGSVELGELNISDGQVAITDLQKHQSRAVYDHIDLTLTDFAAGKPFGLELAAHLPGEGKQLLSLDGKAGPISAGNMITMPLDGTVKFNEVSLSGLQKFLNSAVLAQTDATATGKADLKSQNGKLSSAGSLTLEKVRVNGVPLDYSISADYNASDDLANDIIHIQKADLKLGSMPVSISGDVNTHPTPAQLDLKVNTSNASLAELAKLAGAFGVAFNPGTEVAGKLDADIHARGAANQPAMNGTLKLRDLNVSGKDIPQPVKVKAIDLAMTPQAIRSNDFTAQSGSTVVNGSFTAENYTAPNGTINATLKTQNANLGELLNMAKAYGVSAAEGMSGNGSLSLDARVEGPIKHPEALTYTGNGSLANATLNLPQLTKPLQIQTAQLRFDHNDAILQNIRATLGSSNATGQITIRNFAAPQLQFALAADKLNVGELQSMVKPAPAAPARRARADWSLVPRADAAPVTPPPSSSALANVTGTGTLAVGQILYNDMVLSNAKANANLDHGVIRLNPVTADLFGGQQAGSITVDTRPAETTYIVNSKLSNVDSNKLLSATTSLKQVLFGLLAANSNLSFASSPNGDITRTLNGVLDLDLRNGKLANVDMLSQLASVAKFGNLGRAAQDFTKIVQLNGKLNVKNGLASTDNLKAVIEGGSLSASGLANLVDQSLNMHVIAVLNKDYTQQVSGAGGAGIGGLMNTALANKNGELVIPVIVTGTFAKPLVAPDVEKIAQMKLQNLLPTSANPGSLTSGILGGLTNGQNNGQGGLGGILGALGKKQQQQQQQQQPNQQQPNQQQQQQPQQNQVQDLLNSFGLGKKKKN